MLRHLTSALILSVGFALGQASADDFAQDGMKVRIPNGWTAVKVKLEDGDAVALVSPRLDSTGALCLIAAAKVEDTVGASQEMLNQLVTNLATEDFWRDMAADPSISNYKILETGSTVREGRRVAFAKSRFDQKNDGAIGAKNAIQLSPGRMFLAECLTSEPSYSSEEADFEVVLNSFGPLGGEDVVASLPPRSAGQVAVWRGAPAIAPAMALSTRLEKARHQVLNRPRRF